MSINMATTSLLFINATTRIRTLAELAVVVGQHAILAVQASETKRRVGEEGAEEGQNQDFFPGSTKIFLQYC